MTKNSRNRSTAIDAECWPAVATVPSGPVAAASAVIADLSNDLFGEFLDETMTYSSALFDRLPASWPDLAEAQRHKIDRLLDAAGVGPGTRLLEIGTGWGELCIRAAARGADVRSLTLSERQLWLARQRVAAAGLVRPGAGSTCATTATSAETTTR